MAAVQSENREKTSVFQSVTQDCSVHQTVKIKRWTLSVLRHVFFWGYATFYCANDVAPSSQTQPGALYRDLQALDTSRILSKEVLIKAARAKWS